jgi:ABC-type Na+ efflux pump permease subunit
MRKILTIANREYRAIVGTKAFLFSIAIMPIMMFGGMIAMKALKNSGTIDERKVALIDRSGEFASAVQLAAEQNNTMLQALTGRDEAQSTEASQESDEGQADDGLPSIRKGSRYVIELIEPRTVTDALRLELSDRIRKQDLYAFVEIPEDVVDHGSVSVYSEDSGLSGFTQWLGMTINERAKALRFQEIGLDAEVVTRATRRVEIKGLGLLQKSTSGEIQAAVEKDELTTILLPLFAMMLMFMVIFMSSQPMLESVLEEKSQRIAEVLLGSASPSQLMAGKLMGSVAGSLTVAGLYFAGGYFLADSQGYADKIPMKIIPWFLVFQVLGVMFFAAIFMAVGASVSQLKEAQAMLLPVWILLMCPMFVWFYIVQEPNGPLAYWFSFFPPATPTTMVLRMATGTTIPTWQPWLGALLLVLATAVCVFIAGRIFRVGILWQGKTPRFSELIRWALTG